MKVTQPKDEIVQLIGFYVGKKLFGADILTIQEILRQPEIEPVTSGHRVLEGLEGIVHLRGNRIPVIDLVRRLGKSGATTPRDKIWTLIARSGGLVTGYIVDSVTRILKVGIETILPAPDLVLAGLPNQYIRGVCKTDGGLLVMIDLDRMLVVDEIQALKSLMIR